MKLFSHILIMILTSQFSFAQRDNYQLAMDQFQVNFNDEKYDLIFNDFSPEMKKALPMDNTRKFLSGLRSQFGKIEDKEFLDHRQGSYHTFKTKFEKAILGVHISLDDQNQINGFFIKPYEEPRKSEGKTIKALEKYPGEIADIIFSKSKDFPNKAQVSIAVVRNGQVQFYGISKMNDTIRPADNQGMVFEIGSITKVFTSAVLASLVTDHKLKLEDKINSYFPFAFKDSIKISFISLANHTSGLPRLPENLDLTSEVNPYKNYGKKELEEYLLNLLEIGNGTSGKYAYSNLGAGLLGYTLGLSQEVPFQKLLERRIFEPYKMKSSYTRSGDAKGKLVKGMDKTGRMVSNWDFDVLFGGGGILSTAEDLVTFAKAQFDPRNRELTLTRQATYQIKDGMEMGLGWHIVRSQDGKEIHWHNGGTGGYSSSMAVQVDARSAVIILSNVSDVNEEIDDLCFELLRKTAK